ncbi:MAG: TrwC relaxase, partial [Gammaproteobacteria bacterium]
MLTIAKLRQWSVRYYNDTSRAALNAAMDRRSAGGGLGEYYTEGETRGAVWMVAGDAAAAAGLAGLSDEQRAGGVADLDVVARWLDDGVAPNGASGRRFAERHNHGFDLTFCAPKSVSVLRALDTTGVVSKAVVEAHTAGITAAMEYLARHAGYTRVHNPETGMKDLVRLPGLIAAGYQHETSRAGDPHLHTHVLVPNRQPRADGTLVAIDSDSLWHEARAAGVIYQATLRRRVWELAGLEWEAIDGHSAMAEIAGVDPAVLAAASQRSTQLHQWAAAHLEVGESVSAAQLASAQKATRPKKPEHRPWAELRQEWGVRFGEVVIDPMAQAVAREARVTAGRVRAGQVVAAAVAGIARSAFTRADLVEALGARLPVTVEAAAADPLELVEALAERAAVRISEPRAAHEREGHERFTAAPMIAEEIAVWEMIGARSTAAVIDAAAVDTAGLSADQRRAVAAVAASPWLVQVLTAPAGAGKTTSLRALRAAAHAGEIGRVVVVAPTGRAVDVALAEGAADTGATVASALADLREGRWQLDAATLLLVDEAGMVGTPALRELLAATTTAGVKTVLVGDAHQLAPVRSRGGMFAELVADLPWAQHLSQVWRMGDPGERDASLVIRDGAGAQLAAAVGWYRDAGRLHTGDPVTIAADALAGWNADHTAGVDALLIADRWEIAAALNERI